MKTNKQGISVLISGFGQADEVVEVLRALVWVAMDYYSSVITC
jgi:hypothetical protein